VKFQRRGLGYLAGWDDVLAEITVDHLRRRSGELHGEIMASSGLVSRGHLHRANFNLSSTTARDRLAKFLAAKSTPHTIDWGAMLEDFCTRILEAERKGAPIQQVGRMPLRVAQAYTVHPLVPSGKTTIIYGAGGTGKSYVATAIGVCVATGRVFLGLPVQAGPVLYLDWETDAYEVDERVKRVSRGLGVPAPEIHYRACAGPFEDIAEHVAGFVAEFGIGLVIVDSVGMASAVSHEGGDANEGAIRLFTGLRYLNTTILAIDHITGADVGSDKSAAKPYGSIYKVNLARSVFELRRSREDGDGAHLGLYHRKVNSGRLEKPIGIRVDHIDDVVRFSKEDIVEADLVMAEGNSARILRALRTGPKTVEQIAEDTGLSQGVVRTTLNRGKPNQFSKEQSTGLWAPTYQSPVSAA
jgi:hypothetical protein